MCTEFYDMHSGGGAKTDWEVIFIELPEKEAIDYFKKRFDRHPFNVTCDCCGEDFFVNEVNEPIKNQIIAF